MGDDAAELLEALLLDTVGCPVALERGVRFPDFGVGADIVAFSCVDFTAGVFISADAATWICMCICSM